MKDESSFSFRAESHLKLAKMQFWRLHWRKLFLFIFIGPRPIQDGSWDAFLLKVCSWQGCAGHSFLFGLLSRLGRRDALVFSSPHLLGLAFSLSRERLDWCSLLTLLLLTKNLWLLFGSPRKGAEGMAQTKKNQNKVGKANFLLSKGK